LSFHLVHLYAPDGSGSRGLSSLDPSFSRPLGGSATVQAD
jgi:hypothetical protein